MAAEFKTAQPVEFYRQFLKAELRPDGRELGEIRSTVLNVGSISTSDGSALVKLGNTTVVCGIKAEFASPTIEEPKRGFLVPNVDLPPLCASRFKPGPPSEQAQVTSQFVADTLSSSNIIDYEDLCIQEGKLVWVLYCDMMCLDYDGNINDACLISLLAALKNVTLPVVKIDEETELAVTSSTERSSLKIRSHPVATTFSVFDDSILLVDPTVEEEDLATGLITVVITKDGRLCNIHKPGGTPLSSSQVQVCIGRAKARATEVCQLIDETLGSVGR
ncbi:exosome complex component RRP43-like [Diadema antillarum]|uniref:exosome complex component RRP43-like n=1 Tax=Diadema antillarum TaxID=105358 RepID=UPI003A8A7CAE